MQVKLTKEEKAVLILLGRGETYSDALKMLNLSQYAMQQIRKGFLTKLGARNHVHALYLALLQNLIEVPDN